MRIEGVQSKICIHYIEQGGLKLRVTVREAVASHEVVLPKIGSEAFRCVTGVVLMVPRGFPLREQAGSMVEIQGKRGSMQQSPVLLLELFKA